MNTQEAVLRQAYKKRRPELRLTGDWVASVIKEAIKNQEHDLINEIPSKPRIKNAESFVEKALRRGKQYTNPLRDIQDQVGIRYVFLLRKQVQRVCEIIKNIECFTIANVRDPDIEMEEHPEIFGYASNHFVVYPVNSLPYKGKRLNPEIACEIQVRTLLQHTFAQLSHECCYKPSLKLPTNRANKLNRILAQGAALTEVADSIFAEVNGEITKYNKHAFKLLAIANKMFTEYTGINSTKTSPGLTVLVDLYKDEIDRIHTGDFERWLRSKEVLICSLKQRKNRGEFFFNPIALLMGFLAERNPRGFQHKWIFDKKYLEEVGHFFGISF